MSSQWLNEHISDPDLVVLDSTVIVTMDNGKMSSISGKPRYDEGHIPNAGFADLKGAMSSDDIELDFIMPTPEQFAQAIGELGVDNNSRVVVYSTDSHVWATRLWWMLRWAGLEQVAVLDGGFASWEREGRAISTEPSNHTPKKFKLALNPGLISDREEVFNAIYDDKVNIIDTLPPASYNGEFTMYARPGHIVTAINMPASDLINESGYYKSYDELDMRQEGDRSQRTITYCGAGITATGTAFILQRLGFTDVAVYMGSLQEWAPDAENPMTIEGVPNR
ncbi:MAG: sulfurtransferase [Gammaproteobacteria bacterium]|nr:sulfurtransferase [Gammaproteobacteria bacterium]